MEWTFRLMIIHLIAFFLSDPAPNDDDVERFVDEYMQMKKDGHIKFYTKDEWKKMGSSVDLMYFDGFDTIIRFPRKKDTALEFDDIISRHNPLEYARLYLDGTMQMWIDAEDSLELW